ncbi:MAG: type II toxin-antitoxin system VapB family antitoxin [Deltaproteobacteria bacterium]|nr:type II toxin-antitoxin system VapB family antitoxin [Deltaproteobacteria bacterium]
MRTNIDLDDQLMEDAFKVSRARTKKDLIHEALEEFVQSRRRLSLIDLEGRVEFAEGYDHKRMREDK